MEPKTIEEYQELVKDLKLQLKKSEKKNIELIVRMTDKNKAQDKEKKGVDLDQAISLTKRAVKVQAAWRGYHQRLLFREELRKIARSDPKAGVKVNTNQTALTEINTAVKKMGLNMEMLFRSCDVEGRGEVTLEDFRLFIRRLGLKKVSQAQINRLLLAIDEDCTGVISKEEYNNCLAAYSVNSEGKARTGARTFEQDCLLKFGSVLKARDVKPEEVYNFCDVNQAGTIRTAQLAKFIGNLSEPFQEKEIRAILQYLDVDSNDKIPREFFLKELNKALSISERGGYQSPDKTRPVRSPEKPPGSSSEFARPVKLASFGDDMAKERARPSIKMDTPKFIEKNPSNQNNSRVIKPITTVKKPPVSGGVSAGTDSKTAPTGEADNETKNLKRMIVKMELAEKPIYGFLENYLLGLSDPKGVKGNDLLKVIDNAYGETLTRNEKLALVKAMDNNVNGTIGVKETQQFFLTMARESKEKIITAKLLQICIAKTLVAEDKTTEDYLKAVGIQGQRAKLQDFQNKLRIAFDLDQERADEIFKEVEDRGNGTVDVAEFIRTVDSYRGSKPQKTAQAGGKSDNAPVLSHNRPEKPVASEAEADTKNLKRIIVKMEVGSKPIYEFLERFLLSVKDLKKGVNASEFLKLLDKDYGEVLTKAEKTTLMKALDQNVNGTIDVFEVKQFFLSMAKQSKERIVSTRLLLISIAKSLELEGQSTEDFLKANGIKNTQRCTLQEFHAKLKGAFDLEDKEANEIFMELDDRGSGTIDIAHLISTINSFRGDMAGAQQPSAGAGAAAEDKLNTSKSKIGQVLSLPTNVQALMEAHVKKIVERDPQKETKDFKKAVTKLELADKPIYDLLLPVVEDILDARAGLPLNHIRDKWQKETAGILTDKELETLLGKIDVRKDGNISSDDILACINSNCAVTKERLLSSELLIALMAKEAQAQPATTERFLESYGIYLKNRLTVETFQDKLTELVTVPEEYEKIVFEPFNFKGAGYVDIEELVKNINEYRNDLTNKGKVSYKLAVETLLQDAIYKSIVDDEQEKTEKEARAKDEQTLELFKKLLREKGTKPMDFFDSATNGDTSCNAMSFRTAIQRTGIKINAADLAKVVKMVDVNGNGTLELSFYEMAVMDEEGLKIFQAYARGERETDEIDEKVVNKVKDILKEMEVQSIQLFRECDTKSMKSITLVQLKEGMKRILPCSKLTYAENLKFMKSMDIHHTGIIREDDYNFVMNRTKPGAGLTRVIKGSSDPRAELASPSKIAGDGKEDDLKDAIQKFKSLVNNPKIALKPEQLFQRFDKDKDNVITRAEFLETIDSFDSKINLSERQKVLLVSLADKNRDNKIDYQEFLGLLKVINTDGSAPSVADLNDPRNPASGVRDMNVKGQASTGNAELDKLVAKLKKYAAGNQGALDSFEYNFRKMDNNKDDLLNRKEFFQAVNMMNIGLNDNEKELLYVVADVNRDGFIHLEEFFDFFRIYDIDLGGVGVHQRQMSRDSQRSRSITPRGKTVPSMAEIIAPVEQEATDKAFDEYMATVTIKESDYFRPDKRNNKTTTILNNMVVALKRCHEIVKDLEAKGKTHWDDPDFGPQSPGDHGESSIYVNDRPPGYPDPELIQWFRPSEIVTDHKTVFMDKEADTNDVIQGQIGDCWLIGGFSVIATQPGYIKGDFEITPELVKQMKDKELTDEEAEGMQNGMWCPVFHYLKKYGIYVIRFFKNFGWRYVIMDDKLPCYKYEDSDEAPELVFGKCRNHYEFWVPLLEKAYAKLHQCYETTIGGYIDDGLTDMTGLVAYKYKLHGPKGFPSPQVGSAEELWQKLLEFRTNYSMMGCSIQGAAGETEKEVTIDGEPVGLVKNHAYSIIDILEIPNPAARNAHNSHRLLRIRNPWGTKEWNGEWSDGSTKLLLNLQKLNGYIKERARKGKLEPFDPEANDGTFLMSFKDWRHIFHNLFVCIDFPDEWSGMRFIDTWTPENSGGTPLKQTAQSVKDWANNPQFVMNINNKNKKTTKLLISLGQDDGRLLRDLKFPFKECLNPAVFTVASLKAGEKKLETFDGSRIKKLSALKEYREIAIDLELENGSYVIVPSTGTAGQTGGFVLNVYFECDKSEITFSKAGSNLKGEIIQEEEETPLHYDKELKNILKLKMIATICEDELEASLMKSAGKAGTRGQIESLLDASMNRSRTLTPTKSRPPMDTSKSKIIKNDFDPSEANKLFNNIMNGIMLKDTDFFREGCTTILNNYMACLKECHEILKGMKRQGRKYYVDPEFGPASPEQNGLEFICDDPECPPSWVPDPESIQWLRLKELCPPEKFPHFLSNGADSGDVLQGSLGDCWFISALSVLANNDKWIRGNFQPTAENMKEISDEEARNMITGAYPPIFHWLRQFGIYVIRFYKNYEWRYVIVDDRIPTMKYPDEPPRIIFAKCLADDEFWVPIIEKAYAKIHHTYEALAKGAIDDGLNDMTALVSDKSKIQDRVGKGNTREKKDEFWKELMDQNMAGTMMGCSIKANPGETEQELIVENERMGILKGHAYSILDVFELRAEEVDNYHKSHRLIRLRNPWGNKEWSGKWADGSDKFVDNVHKIEKYMREEKIRDPEYEILDTKAMDDGTFLMCYKDWRTHFNNLFMCLDWPSEWSGLRYRDEWTKDNSGGFPTQKDMVSWAKNPQFVVQVSEPTKCFLSLGQKDGRLEQGQKFPYPGIVHCVMVVVLKLNDGEEKTGLKEYDHSRMIGATPAKEYRETSLFITLQPGKYLLVPCTKSPRQVGNFFLDLYFSCPKNKLQFSKANTSVKPEIIVEEEEGEQHFDDNLKLVLKAKAAEVIFNDEASLQEKTLSFIE